LKTKGERYGRPEKWGKVGLPSEKGTVYALGGPPAKWGMSRTKDSLTVRRVGEKENKKGSGRGGRREGAALQLFKHGDGLTFRPLEEK